LTARVRRSSRPFCAEFSAEGGEPLAATASRIDHWLLVEYRGLWSPEPLAGSALSEAVKDRLQEQVAALPRSRLLFIRRPDRRSRPELTCFFGRTREEGSRFVRLELESHEDLLGVDFTSWPGNPLEHPLLVVCTHGKRDRCCARYGRPLYDALCAVMDEDHLWQCTHVGGDRFAGNLVCFPEGLYFGRVDPADAWALLEEYLAGRIHLPRYRGRCCYSFPVQAAEVASRHEARARGIDALRLEGVERIGSDAWRVAFRADGRRYEADVVAELGDLALLTCDAPAPKRPRHYVARLRR
jgi:hypothetical protein